LPREGNKWKIKAGQIVLILSKNRQNMMIKKEEVDQGIIEIEKGQVRGKNLEIIKVQRIRKGQMIENKRNEHDRK